MKMILICMLKLVKYTITLINRQKKFNRPDFEKTVRIKI